MTIEKELLTEAEEKKIAADLKRDNSAYRKALVAGNLNSKKLLAKGVRLLVYRMSMKKYRRTLHEVRAKLFRDINQAAAKTKERPLRYKEFRKFYLQQVVDRTVELLDGNYHVRLNAVITLSMLNLTEGTPQQNILPVAFVPAAEPLMQVMNQSTAGEWHEAIKIHAAKGLRRIALYGKPNSEPRVKIATSLINQLKNPKHHRWYQVRLAEALGAVNQFLDTRNREPFIVATLLTVMVDNNRHWEVRCEAAKSLGRTPMNGQINVHLIVFEIVKLVRQMSKAYNKNPGAFFWRECYFKVYLAFKALDAEEKARNAGFLARVEKGVHAAHRGVVKSAYQEQILPLVNQMFDPKARGIISKKRFDELDNWLSEKKPINLRVYPGLEPIAAAR